MIKNIVFFASGSGSNIENIIEYFKDNKDVNISLIFTNNVNAYVVERAYKYSIPVISFDKDMFYKSTYVADIIELNKPDLIVLAGFLWLLPDFFVKRFPNKIINIHPALLPKYGGKGMYGMKVHEAVRLANENESGITIHYVDEVYDNGKPILQAKCAVSASDTPNDIANKVHQLEYEYFPKVIEQILFG